MKISQKSRARKQAEQSRDREGAELTGHARELTDPAKTKSVAGSGLPALPTGPRAYFITFSCYGCWLHGDAGGSVDRRHNVFATSVIESHPGYESSERARMDQPAYELDATRRGLILKAIQDVCAHRGWWLFTVHVRTTHVHVIVQAGDPPEKVMNDFKTYASRALNQAGCDKPARKRWAHHGSTRYLWVQEDLEGAIHYVLHEQGEPMAIYAGPGVTRPNNRFLTVGAQMSDQSRARKQAEPSNPVKKQNNRSLTVGVQLGGFTMMEIAISLAVIGIALVAIIGVLPIGMGVQQNNRQETIIGQDATVIMDAVRNGALGYDDLTNYVYAITNYWTEYAPLASGGATNGLGVNGYTYGSVSINNPQYFSLTGLPNGAQEPITNAANIIGLLSTPEYIGANGDVGGDLPGQPIPSLTFGGISNHIVVYCHSISGPAIEKPPQDNVILQQDSFSYRIFCVNAPVAIDTNLFYQYPLWPAGQPYPSNSTVFYNWMYWTYDGPGVVSGPPVLPPGETNLWSMAPQYNLELSLNLRELRLTFEWPQLPNGNLGPGRETFRTLVAGKLQHQPPLSPFTFPASTVWYDPNLWAYASGSFTNTP